MPMLSVNERNGNNTEAYQEHKACGYGYKTVCQYDDKYSKPTMHILLNVI